MAHNQRFIIANITWNKSGWRNIYVDPRAGHAYARAHPGHESLNFEFNKKGLDSKDKVFGYVQWTSAPVKLSNQIVIFFYSRNLEAQRGEIVGAYGDAEILNPPIKTKWKGFEKNELTSDISADKRLSLLFDIPLNANRYARGGRLVPQVGFTYIESARAKQIVVDELKALEISGVRRDVFEKLTGLFEFISGEKYPDPRPLGNSDSDEREQEQLARDMEHDISLDAAKRAQMIEELKSLTDRSPERVEYKGRSYRRDNKTIAQLKVLRNFKCQICGNNIRRKDGTFYVEAAHIVPKREKGAEKPSNILILCPNHHKEFDLGSKNILEQNESKILIVLNGQRQEIGLMPE